jgi:SAM-dependent methyltransferase
MQRRVGPEAASNFERRRREGFFEKYLSGEAVLDIGYRGGDPASEPITDNAIGVDLDFPGYDGKTLPFDERTQDAVFASHVLEHIEDPIRALADWYRVLKIGGYLVIAVPHRDLYERKATLPSRYNADHKRFYTPASLLDEIEEALPVAGYRIRMLRDIDDGFDYTIPPSRHATGCYEIELVLQKIKVPGYADQLRPSPLDGATVTFFASVLAQALKALRRGDRAAVQKTHETLSALPLPSFSALRWEIERLVGPLADNSELASDVWVVLRPLIALVSFDADWYLRNNPDVARSASGDPSSSARSHFILHGYREGRAPRPDV